MAQALKLLLQGSNADDLGRCNGELFTRTDLTYEQLDTKAHYLESILSAFIKHTRNEIVNIRIQQNALVPIHRLPAELLQDIFLHQALENHLSDLKIEDLHMECMKPLSTSHDLKKPRTKMYSLIINMVTPCSRWYQLALSTPNLWSYLESSSSLELIRVLLERSKRAPLHISFLAEVESQHERQFMDLVLPHLYRWQSFTAASKVNQLLYQIDTEVSNGRPAPSLERFIVHKSALHTPVPSFVLNHCPRLQELHIAAGSPYCPLGQTAFSSLSHLTTIFSPDGGSSSYEMEQMELLFSSSPLLRTVFLRGPRRNALSLQPFSVNLHYLESIVLYRMNTKVALALLHSIFPRKGSHPGIKFYGKWEGWGLKETMWDSSRTGSLLDVALRSMNWVSLTYSSLIWGYTMTAGMDAGGVRSTLLEIQSTASSTTEAFTLLLDLDFKYTSHVNDMEIELRSMNDGTFLPSLLHLYPHVERLTIITSEPIIYPLINALYLSPREDTIEGLSIPLIKILSLKGRPSIENLAEILKARCGPQEAELMSSPLLAHLEKIEAQSSSSDEEGMIQESMLYLQKWGVRLEIIR
ncbi:hypothetical protein FRC02_003613 [Tulasnella sp. 418]|nr:hypothetical protein FRC02_003613 [Tulasnella sp. 418]